MYAATGTNTGFWQPFDKTKQFAVWICKMQPSKRAFRPTKNADVEKRLLEDSIPKSTRESTKWVDQIFNEWKMGKANKDPSLESDSFSFDMSKIRVDTNIVNISAESQNSWLTKFIQEVCKENGQGYPGRTLYIMVCGIQRYLNKENASLAVSLLAKNKMRYGFCNV